MNELNPQTKHNFYSFWTNPDDETKTKLECIELSSDMTGKFAVEEDSELGHKYQILIVRDHKEDEEKFADLDVFEGILLHPPTYIKRMMQEGWYGMVVRKSEKSQQMLDVALDSIKNFL